VTLQSGHHAGVTRDSVGRAWWGQAVSGRVVRGFGISVTVLIVVAACSGGSPHARTASSACRSAVSGTFSVVGTLRIVSRATLPIPGTVTAVSASGESCRSAADNDGSYKLALNPGVYQLFGQSPRFNGGAGVCHAERPVAVAKRVRGMSPIFETVDCQGS
jgi:hypothetical protein